MSVLLGSDVGHARFFLHAVCASFPYKIYISTVCVCVCVFFPFILETKVVGRTSRGHFRFFSGFLLRTLVVGRRQHSESIEVALDME